MSSMLWVYTGTVLLLVMTPGLDTALILRTSLVQGARQAIFAALGINLGLLCWGALVAAGLGALLTASELAYHLLKWVGAAYLAWLGIGMLLRPRQSFHTEGRPQTRSGTGWLLKGLASNVLNPKVGVFYVSFLPQFIPEGASIAGYAMMLASIHVLLGIIWCGLLIAATRPLGRRLREGALVRWMDRVTGGVFVAFAARLALTAR
ncbi:LysE family translocator [Carnimonas bestiolae]|uniref:LysE family translocator n=1 Tax=Carnimonas bestiolae TaxID=3402172 RepID=UPI003EDC4ACC